MSLKSDRVFVQALIREYEEKRDAYNAKYEDIVGAMSSLDIQKENAHRAQQRKSGKSRKGNLMCVSWAFIPIVVL